MVYSDLKYVLLRRRRGEEAECGTYPSRDEISIDGGSRADTGSLEKAP